MAFHELAIREVGPETAEAVRIIFDLPGPLRDAFAFEPGQHLTLRATVDGQDVRRSYSIASGPGEALSVGVKHLRGGAFSEFARGLRPGDRLQVMAPEGRFFWRGECDVLLIAAGSGITPMMAIAAAALKAGGLVTLVYGNRSVETIMFRAALDALKDRYMGRFSVIHVLSREFQDVELLNGRIDAEKLAALAAAGVIDPKGAKGVFLCGPGGMIETLSAGLAAMGVAPERIHQEHFTPSGDAPRTPSKAAEAVAAKGAAVEVVHDGRRRAFRYEDKDTGIIDAAARQGVDLPWSCHGGMCCTCRCKVVEGQAEMAVNYSLEPWEIEAGYTLACQSRPVTEKLVLDFDAA
ncbi:1,2-phenylacetyl-CoA epoxidase, subunit E [Defluviimonas aquaemixtae]|uniref:1,2-phenylacetyl-CoA epoxidase, subunit E n=1 Tax=Albidovulum aquaemixtae TaxID=1542388 RepID=A0A2R8BJS2_9RHOB|nr:2Fe-2S iron-sulfur cluster-binding protein [Defluviimonas aquaemixtae]SPH23647.1 1,2-phenylacetyl-CoA epoxidase, subunit E [Defluviimonas aquaemixtae]